MFEPATPAQIRYLEYLLHGRGFTTRVRRNGWLSVETGKDVHFLDDLSKAAASRLIDQLLEKEEDAD